MENCFKKIVIVFVVSLVARAQGAVHFQHVPSLQQREVAGHSLHCGYYALYNAARFVNNFAGIATSRPAVADRAAAYASLINDRAHFSVRRTTGAPSPLDRWQARTAIFRRSTDVSFLSAAELEDVICKGSGAGRNELGEMRVAGKLLVFGSRLDLNNCTGEHFTMGRLGKSMQQLQAGQPVAFLLCLDAEEEDERGFIRGGGGFQHWVAVGLYKEAGNLQIYTMDSFGNNFDAVLQGEIERLATYMISHDPLQVTVDAFLTPRCTDGITQLLDLIGTDAGIQAPTSPLFIEQITSWFKPTVQELKDIPGCEPFIINVMREHFAALDAALGVADAPTAYQDAVVALVMSWSPASAPLPTADVVDLSAEAPEEAMAGTGAGKRFRAHDTRGATVGEKEVICLDGDEETAEKPALHIIKRRCEGSGIGFGQSTPMIPVAADTDLMRKMQAAVASWFSGAKKE